MEEILNAHTAKNATDLLEGVIFTDLIQLVNKLQKKTCQFHQVETSMLKPLVVTCYLQTCETMCSKRVENKSAESTCNKTVDNLQ